VDLELRDKVAIVGGGSLGLGRATAEGLAREGVKLAIYALPDEDLDVAVRELSEVAGRPVLGIGADIRSADDCARVVAETASAHGGVDLLVTNMGGSYMKPFPDDDDAWHDAWDMWALGPIRLMRHAVPLMRERGGGSIVNITSCGVHELVPETKFSEIPRLALTGYAKYTASELAEANIRVNNVLPGWVATPRSEVRFREDAAARGVSFEDAYAAEVEPIPMKRFGAPGEIADAIAFLLSARAAYITGVNLRVDGGWCKSPTI
jgi:3-oxoacyl-[acyl-carrier protein] reductase